MSTEAIDWPVLNFNFTLDAIGRDRVGLRPVAEHFSFEEQRVRALRQHLGEGAKELIVASFEGRIVGLGSIAPDALRTVTDDFPDVVTEALSGQGMLADVLVDPDWRQMGAARKIVQACEAQLWHDQPRTDIALVVAEDRDNARHLYQTEWYRRQRPAGYDSFPLRVFDYHRAGNRAVWASRIAPVLLMTKTNPALTRA